MIKFICDNCGKETKVGKSAITLQCQTCGSYDLKFDCSVESLPIMMGGELGKGVLVKKGESFYGLTSYGSLWLVKSQAGLDPTILPIVSESLEEKPSEEIPKEDNKQAKKIKLTKAIRKLKIGIDQQIVPFEVRVGG